MLDDYGHFLVSFHRTGVWVSFYDDDTSSSQLRLCVLFLFATPWSETLTLGRR
jgi:hypothetical protein